MAVKDGESRVIETGLHFGHSKLLSYLIKEEEEEELRTQEEGEK